MPFYKYYCQKHGAFEVLQPICGIDSPERTATCSECGKLADSVFSPCRNFRVAVPLTVLQDLGPGKGYEKLSWVPDSEDTPGPGLPYKTAADVLREM